MKEVEQFLTDLGISLEDANGEVFNRPIRVSCNGSIDIGETRDTFDRFANSTEFSFDGLKKTDQRKFSRWYAEQGESK